MIDFICGVAMMLLFTLPVLLLVAVVVSLTLREVIKFITHGDCKKSCSWLLDHLFKFWNDLDYHEQANVAALGTIWGALVGLWAILSTIVLFAGDTTPLLVPYHLGASLSPVVIVMVCIIGPIFLLHFLYGIGKKFKSHTNNPTIHMKESELEKLIEERVKDAKRDLEWS